MKLIIIVILTIITTILSPFNTVDALGYMCKKILNKDTHSLQIVATFQLNQTTTNSNNHRHTYPDPLFVFESNQIYTIFLAKKISHFNPGQYNSTAYQFVRLPQLIINTCASPPPTLWHESRWFDRLYQTQFYHSSLKNFDIFEHTSELEALIRLQTEPDTLYRIPLSSNSGRDGNSDDSGNSRKKLGVIKVNINSLIPYSIIRDGGGGQQQQQQGYLLIGDVQTRQIVLFDLAPFRDNIDALINHLRRLSFYNSNFVANDDNDDSHQHFSPEVKNVWQNGFSLYRGYGITIVKPYHKPFATSNRGGPPLLLEYDDSSVPVPVGYIYDGVVYLIDASRSMMYVFRYINLGNVTTTITDDDHHDHDHDHHIIITTTKGEVNGIFGLQEYFNCSNFCDDEKQQRKRRFPIFPEIPNYDDGSGDGGGGGGGGGSGGSRRNYDEDNSGDTGHGQRLNHYKNLSFFCIVALIFATILLAIDNQQRIRQWFCCCTSNGVSSGDGGKVDLIKNDTIKSNKSYSSSSLRTKSEKKSVKKRKSPQQQHLTTPQFVPSFLVDPSTSTTLVLTSTIPTSPSPIIIKP